RRRAAPPRSPWRGRRSRGPRLNLRLCAAGRADVGRRPGIVAEEERARVVIARRGGDTRPRAGDALGGAGVRRPGEGGEAGQPDRCRDADRIAGDGDAAAGLLDPGHAVTLTALPKPDLR